MDVDNNRHGRKLTDRRMGVGAPKRVEFDYRWSADFGPGRKRNSIARPTPSCSTRWRRTRTSCRWAMKDREDSAGQDLLVRCGQEVRWQQERLRACAVLPASRDVSKMKTLSTGSHSLPEVTLYRKTLYRKTHSTGSHSLPEDTLPEDTLYQKSLSTGRHSLPEVTLYRKSLSTGSHSLPAVSIVVGDITC